MDNLKGFYEDTSFILAFLVLLLVIQATLGDSFTRWFLLLILFSMIMINSDKFITFIEEAMKYE